MPYPRILVVTSCTGEKIAKPEKQLTLEDFQEVLAYDKLVQLPRHEKVEPAAQAKRRATHAVLYRELLEEQP
jgi:hypothetical protein